MDYPGIDGFLGTRASLMLDVVFLAMFLVIPAMAISIALARFRRAWQAHKLVQMTLGVVLLVAVVAFEVDMQFITKWEARAEPSPYFTEANQWSCPAGIALIVHLLVAVPTTVIWVYTISIALRRFANPPVPSDYSGRHRQWGRVAAVGMTMTGITGWIFYWMAFVAN